MLSKSCVWSLIFQATKLEAEVEKRARKATPAWHHACFPSLVLDLVTNLATVRYPRGKGFSSRSLPFRCFIQGFDSRVNKGGGSKATSEEEGPNTEEECMPYFFTAMMRWAQPSS